MSQESFQAAIQEFGLCQDTADKLWNGNIRSIKELASSKTSVVHGLVEDSVLNTILPVLQKYAFPIVMATDPKKHALNLLRRHAGGGDEEPTSGTASDSMPFTDGPSSYRASNQVPSNLSNGSFSTNRTQMESNNRMNKHAKVMVGGGVPQTVNYGNAMNLSLSGCNMPQANFGGNVTYNNTNTPISSSMYVDSNEALAKKRAEKVEPSSFNIEGVNVSTSSLGFISERNFWLNDVEVQRTSEQEYQRHLKDKSVYPIKPRDSGRALIINNITFSGAPTRECAPTREGAEKDSTNLETVLRKLGFDIESHKNKKKAEILAILDAFSNTSRNKECSVSLVFIGSHGERENNRDYFIDVEKQRIPAEDVISNFTARNCPNLNGKPKLFFFQFCRKEKHNYPTISSDSIPEQPSSAAALLSSTQSDAGPDSESAESMIPHDKADMLVSFATAAGTKAYRDTKDGSWYVTALVKTLQEKANSEDMLSMMTMINQSVMSEEAEVVDEERRTTQVVVQMAECSSTLAKKVKFFPCLR